MANSPPREGRKKATKPAHAVPLASACQHQDAETQAGHSPERAVEGPLSVLRAVSDHAFGRARGVPRWPPLWFFSDALFALGVFSSRSLPCAPRVAPAQTRRVHAKFPPHSCCAPASLRPFFPLRSRPPVRCCSFDCPPRASVPRPRSQLAVALFVSPLPSPRGGLAACGPLNLGGCCRRERMGALQRNCDVANSRGLARRSRACAAPTRRAAPHPAGATQRGRASMASSPGACVREAKSCPA